MILSHLWCFCLSLKKTHRSVYSPSPSPGVPDQAPGRAAASQEGGRTRQKVSLLMHSWSLISGYRDRA